ncbi:hypothetical protein [uncultured Jannaschia sp.]|uniref:hypothetical protein n=1 Tax=uncultured Jannaschia sp. TaxID=293347 RepID=UPI002637F2C9|nr:hypothetical protein [uncultured Jannaschia sp.]
MGLPRGVGCAGALENLFKRLDQAITAAGYLPRGSQIVNASLAAAPRQRNTEGEKAAIKDGQSADEQKARMGIIIRTIGLKRP